MVDTGFDDYPSVSTGFVQILFPQYKNMDVYGCSGGCKVTLRCECQHERCTVCAPWWTTDLSRMFSLLSPCVCWDRLQHGPCNTVKVEMVEMTSDGWKTSFLPVHEAWGGDLYAPASAVCTPAPWLSAALAVASWYSRQRLSEWCPYSSACLWGIQETKVHSQSQLTSWPQDSLRPPWANNPLHEGKLRQMKRRQ